MDPKSPRDVKAHALVPADATGNIRKQTQNHKTRSLLLPSPILEDSKAICEDVRITSSSIDNWLASEHSSVPKTAAARPTLCTTRQLDLEHCRYREPAADDGGTSGEHAWSWWVCRWNVSLTELSICACLICLLQVHGCEQGAWRGDHRRGRTTRQEERGWPEWNLREGVP